MKIKKVTFSGLFNKLDYDLDFSNFNVNILTGPNGYGKTIILKSINHLIDGNLSFFEKLKFKKFIVLFDTLKITINKHEELHIEIEQQWSTESLVFRKKIDDIQSDGKLSIDEIDLKLKRINIINTSRNTITERLKECLANYSSLFVKDQRINTYINDKNETTLIALARDLKEKISITIDEYNKLSQKLDATFPIRLLEIQSKPKYEMIEERLNGLKSYIYTYTKYGFLNEASNTKFDIQEISLSQKQENAHVLELYLLDSLEKYSAFDSLAEKINLFLRFLNSKELSFKKIIVNKDIGFCAIDSESKDPIELSDLSSGEQNQIIMLYNLIFLTDEKLVLLIDEPEISLHIAWQKEFLNNLERIMKINNIPQVIIATHSPTVINGNWERSLDLYELSNLRGI